MIVAKFPYPTPSGDFSATGLLSDRATSITGEAAVSSRWSLLPALWSEIKTAPVLGKGFGATVTYKSSDPRVLEIDPTGKYTTYAFEWGWLDTWLKLGFFGVLAYIVLIGKIVYDGIRLNLEFRILNLEYNSAVIGLVIGLSVISVVSFFTPYMNHPLGIGYLIVVGVILDKKREPVESPRV